MNERISKKKLNALFLTIICIVITLCFMLWFIKFEHRVNVEDNNIIMSHTGVWDLTNFNFDNGIVLTRGSEEYIEGELLSPQEFEQNSDKIQIGSPKASPVNTSKITLIMPNNDTYIIMGTSYDYAERIFINGELMGEIGTVATNKSEAKPGFEYLNYAIKPQNGVIEIVRQSNNFVHRDNGVATNILIGTPQKMNNIYSIEYGITGVYIGLFFTIAISHVFLFLIFKSYKAHLYFAILSLTWGMRMGVTGAKVFNEWLDFLPWELLFRIEYMSVPLTCAMMLLVSNEIYKGALPKVILQAFVGGFLIYTVVCVFLPTLPLSYSMIAAQAAFMLASVLLLVFIGVKTVIMVQTKKIELKHVVYSVGIVPFVFATIHDALYYNSILIFGVNVLLADLSLMIIVVTQTAVLYFYTAQRMLALHKAEEQSRIETQSLRQAGRMKEEFLRTLSHEMQMPLTTVSGYAQLTGQILKDDKNISRDDLFEKMRIIDDETRKLSRQVQQMLDMSAMENGTFKLHRVSVDIVELINRIEKLHFPIMSAGNITFTKNINNNLKAVFADEERLVQIILNLMLNSIKHANCSKITISAINKLNGDDFVQISVSDDGEGINEEMLEDLFSSYNANRSAKGNGLGLYIVAQMIKAHKGTISVQSKCGSGTSIIFTIPAFREGKNE